MPDIQRHGSTMQSIILNILTTKILHTIYQFQGRHVQVAFLNPLGEDITPDIQLANLL